MKKFTLILFLVFASGLFLLKGTANAQQSCPVGQHIECDDTDPFHMCYDLPSECNICTCVADPILPTPTPTPPPPVPPASISGSVFLDTNRNGVWDGSETRFTTGNLQVCLNAPYFTGWSNCAIASPASVFPPPNSLLSFSGQTGGTGNYSYSGLSVGGSYYLVLSPIPSGYDLMTPNAVFISPLNADTTVNFGIAPISAPAPVTYSVGGFVFDDNNQNGVRDPGEPGVLGATINICTGNVSCAIPTLASTTSDSTGHYQFDGLLAGTYSIDIISGGRTVTGAGGHRVITIP